MDCDGDSPKQNSHRCDRCHRWFADLQTLEEHKRSDCNKTLPCKETSSPELPTRQEIDGPQHISPFSSSSRNLMEVKRSPTEKREHLSPDQGTSKSPSEPVKTPPKSHISSKPKRSPISPYSKVTLSPDQKLVWSPCEQGTSPPPAVSPRVIISPPPARQLNFLPDQGTSKSPSKTSLEVSGSTTNSPGSSTDRDSSRSQCIEVKRSPTEKRVHLSPAFAATPEEEKAIAESSKSVKEGDGNGANLELQALEVDMKQSESNQTSKNDFPEKTLDCVTEEDEELKQSEEATNVLHAQDDGVDFPSASVTHHGRWTQRQQSSLDDPDQHQAADAATSSSDVAERFKQSEKSPESMDTTD